MRQESSAPVKAVISKEMQAHLKIAIFLNLLGVLGIGAFAAAHFFAAPMKLLVLAQALFTGGVVFMGTSLYGVMNDFLAARTNLPYLLLGHEVDQRTLIKSNKVGPNAVAWGMLNSLKPGAIAAALFSIVTAVTGLIGLPFAAVVLPALALMLPLTLTASHLVSRRGFNNRREDPTWQAQLTNDTFFNFYQDVSLSDYQCKALNQWLQTSEGRNSWLANFYRSKASNIVLPATGALGLAAIAAVPAAGAILPAAAFGTLATVYLPLGLAGLGATALATSLLYLAKTHDSQDHQSPYQFEHINRDYRDDSDEANSPNERKVLLDNDNDDDDDVLEVVRAPVGNGHAGNFGNFPSPVRQHPPRPEEFHARDAAKVGSPAPFWSP